jgi:hypothetical protein
MALRKDPLGASFAQRQGQTKIPENQNDSVVQGH